MHSDIQSFWRTIKNTHTHTHTKIKLSLNPGLSTWGSLNVQSRIWSEKDNTIMYLFVTNCTLFLPCFFCEKGLFQFAVTPCQFHNEWWYKVHTQTNSSFFYTGNKVPTTLGNASDTHTCNTHDDLQLNIYYICRSFLGEVWFFKV